MLVHFHFCGTTILLEIRFGVFFRLNIQSVLEKKRCWPQKLKRILIKNLGHNLEKRPYAFEGRKGRQKLMKIHPKLESLRNICKEVENH